MGGWWGRIGVGGVWLVGVMYGRIGWVRQSIVNSRWNGAVCGWGQWDGDRVVGRIY